MKNFFDADRIDQDKNIDRQEDEYIEISSSKIIFIMFLYWLYIFILGNLSVHLIVSSDVDVMHHSNWLLLDHDKCGNSNTDRIIGGKNANMGAYPWMARIGYIIVKSNPVYSKTLHYKCGGFLINKYNVVTAAHCVAYLPKWLKITNVRLGEHNTMTDPDCEKGYCAEPHLPVLKMTLLYYIWISPLFTMAKFVIPICIPYGDLLKKDYTGEMAEVAGWGIYDIETSKSSHLLQTVTMPIQDTEKCKEIFKTRASISDQQICVGGVIGTDSCAGDSGGPLMKVETIDELPKYYVIGLVSFGVEHCGATTTPGVYTKISHYVSWILDNIRKSQLLVFIVNVTLKYLVIYFGRVYAQSFEFCLKLPGKITGEFNLSLSRTKGGSIVRSCLKKKCKIRKRPEAN
ncbi:CLIP domain-containing serine protease HP8-like [Vespula squamosa]|uniref:CLIP domain-containing serine protease HP8-like n=1 Tax=Vespula squamosa TaxID=30214 RepID=A0ABD2APJ5_VESSQ